MLGLSSNAIKYAVKASGPFAKTIAQAQKPAGQKSKPAKAYLPKPPKNPAKVAGVVGSLVGAAYKPAKQGSRAKY